MVHCLLEMRCPAERVVAFTAIRSMYMPETLLLAYARKALFRPTGLDYKLPINKRIISHI